MSRVSQGQEALALVERTVAQEAAAIGRGTRAKRLMDLIVAGSSLIVLAPFLPIIALLVKLDSPGPALHRRRVLGLGGREFDALKFRSMYLDGDALLARQPELQERLRRDGKLRDDPRITPVGRWLRRLSIDELPQLLNVVRGEMSMVGPRMISPAELERFGPYAEELLTVRPGITGLWQVSGRADLAYQDRVDMNIHYIRTRTLWTDLRLLLATLPAVFSGRGAY